MTQDDFDRLVVGGADGEPAQNLAGDTEDGPGNPVAQSYLPATRSHGDGAVSYTHLTLPTICSV